MKLLVALFLINLPLVSFAQRDEIFYPETDSIYKTIFLDGVFETKEDFIKGRRKNYEIYPQTHRKDERYKNGIVADPGHKVTFRYKTDKKVVTKVFAVSYNGFLYFQINGIMEEINRKDRFQNGDRNFDFVRVLLGGQHYIYTECEMADAIEQGLIMQAGPGGYSVAQLLLRNKGIVWDFWKHEFNIFRHCKDFNTFISDKKPESVQDCDKKLNILEVRKAIDKIK